MYRKFNSQVQRCSGEIENECQEVAYLPAILYAGRLGEMSRVGGGLCWVGRGYVLVYLGVPKYYILFLNE